MSPIVIAQSYKDPEPVELVERKGIGHPDTLADLIAEHFSNRYARYCLDAFGRIPNNWVDKVVLAGATAKVAYGEAEIVKPIRAYLFGKITQRVGSVQIPIQEIFEECAFDVLTRVLNSKEIANHLLCIFDVNSGVAADKPWEWFSPAHIEEIPDSPQSYRSNDTVLCSGYADYSMLESGVIKLENYLNGCEFKKRFQDTGYDIKVLAARNAGWVNLTVCIPFIASLTQNPKSYRDRKEEILELLRAKIEELFPKYRASLHFNTRDAGDFAYLTVFGSAIDTGDYGVVGRGNKYNGIIAINRDGNIEAVCGKNPVYHAGKLYTVFLHRLAFDILSKFKIPNSINLSANAGGDLRKPTFLGVKIPKGVGKHMQIEIRRYIEQSLDSIHGLTAAIISSDPIAEHKTVLSK